MWISGKPPSEEVVGILRSYGIDPDDKSEPEGDDSGDVPRLAGAGVSAQVLH